MVRTRPLLLWGLITAVLALVAVASGEAVVVSVLGVVSLGLLGVLVAEHLSLRRGDGPPARRRPGERRA